MGTRFPMASRLLFCRVLLLCLLFGGAQASPGEAETRERIEFLQREIARHDELYFRRATPEITDAAYDELKRELAALEAAHPAWAIPREGATFGDDRSGTFPTAEHVAPMLGLDKVYTEEELRAFVARVVRASGRPQPAFVVEPKFDGLAISVTYRDGRFVRAVTRGNGREGEDVSKNIAIVRGLQEGLRGKANELPRLVELRGEIYMTWDEFRRINEEQESAGEPLYSHPRNLAVGTLKRIDATTLNRQLDVVFYGVGACEPESARPASQRALLAQLRAWGLPTIENALAATGADAVWETVQRIGGERAVFPFPTDGAVVKLDEVAAQREVGESDSAPRWAVAFKFPPERVETRVRGIVWQVGRTGVLTPVADLDPVELGGTTVARVTLHNAEEVRRRDVRVGDWVTIEKAGEIVPAVRGVNLARRPENAVPVAAPERCPECQTPVQRDENAVALRCPNPECPAQLRRRLVHFASRAAVDIRGLGPAGVDALVSAGLVKNVADLYRLSQDKLPSRWRGKDGERLMEGIERSKRAELWRFIHGLGVPEIGVVTSKVLAQRFRTLSALMAAAPEHFVADGKPVLEGVSLSAGESVLAFMADERNRRVIAELVAAGVRPVAPGEVTPLTGPLAGKVVVLTGALPSMTRAEAKQRIERAGGTVAETVTTRTDYLVLGEKPGSKLEAARRLKVLVIDEKELLRLLAGE